MHFITLVKKKYFEKTICSVALNTTPEKAKCIGRRVESCFVKTRMGVA